MGRKHGQGHTLEDGGTQARHELADRLGQEGLQTIWMDPDRIRIVTHLGLSEVDIDETIRILRKVLG